MLCTREASLKMKGVVYKACVRSVLTYGHREENAENDLWSDIEG